MTTTSLVGWSGFRRSFLFVAAVFSVLVGSSQSQSPVAEAVTIVQGKRYSREIEAGQKHAYLVHADAGQLVRGSLSQVGTDLIIRVAADKARWSSEFDGQLRYEGAEPFEFVADANERYRVEVEAKRGAERGSYELSVAEIRPAVELDNKLHKARVLIAAAAAQARAGKYSDAIATAMEALKLREAAFGSNSPEAAFVMNRIGNYFFSSGNDQKSFEYHQRVLAIYDQPGNDDLITSDALNNFGVHLRKQGRFAEAEAHFKRVIAIREKIFGLDAYILGPVLNNLGLLYRVRGDFESAERFYERSLQVREARLGAADLELQFPLTNLAALATFKGDFVRALEIDERVLAIREKRLAAGHPLIAESVYDLGLVNAKLGRIDAAEKLLIQATQMYEKSYGPDSNHHISNYSTLGNLYREKGELAQARIYMDRALRISKLHQQNDPLEYASGLLYSARLRIVESDLIAAERELGESLTTTEKILGPDHSDVREILSSLAQLHAMNGNIARSTEVQSRANAIGERQLAVNLLFGTEHQRLSFASLLNVDLHQTLAIHAYTAPADATLRDLSANILLQRKGRVLDATALSLSAMRKHVSQDSAALLSELSDTTARLSALMLSGLRTEGAESYEKSFVELRKRKDSLEQELSRRSAGYFQPQTTFTIERAKSMIAANAALVEFARVDPGFAFNQRKAVQKAQYVAYVIRRGESVGYVRLGEAAKIDAAAANFRKALRDPTRSDAMKLGRQLDEHVLEPIRTLVGSATHILLSPEGELNVFPFEALVDEDGSFAVQKFQFTYLTSGRDLMRLENPLANSEDPVIVANPSFGTETAGNGVRTAGPASGHTGITRSVTTGKQMSDVYFGPLQATGAEANSIIQIFPNSRLLTGSDATVSALKSIKAPSILHLATHGFFLDDPGNSGGSSVSPPTSRQPSVIENPLVRSGLALAGANVRNFGGEDGLLTALEATGLDLWGTKLTVLSACDTGVGEVRAGEGVYGLRRAFTLAGTQTLLMSMWPVSDQVTRELMTAYYQNLKKGMGRGDALRRVRLDMIKRPSRRHPFYWASFIQSGEWANLAGKR